MINNAALLRTQIAQLQLIAMANSVAFTGRETTMQLQALLTSAGVPTSFQPKATATNIIGATSDPTAPSGVTGYVAGNSVVNGLVLPDPRYTAVLTIGKQVHLQATINLGVVSPIIAPTGVTATPVASGGTFSAGTYYWVVTARTASGETLASAEVSATLVTNGSATLTWNIQGEASSYRVYRATVSGGQSSGSALVATLGTGVGTYTDTGIATSAGNPPVTNGATVTGSVDRMAVLTYSTDAGTTWTNIGRLMSAQGDVVTNATLNVSLGHIHTAVVAGSHVFGIRIGNSNNIHSIKATTNRRSMQVILL